MDNERQKLKLLHLMKLFYEQTDPEHGLSTPQLIEGLAQMDIDAERKSIYRDIDTLRSFGLDIQKLPTRPTTYALMSRTFTASELSLLIDAVQSSRFLTQRISNRLARGVAQMGSKHQAGALEKRVHVEGRIKMQNESVFLNVDVIHKALAAKKKVAFRYFKYDVNKEPVAQNDGRVYVETPVHLIYSDGCYYLIAYNEKHGSFPAYRVDRMQSLRVTDEPAVRNEAIANFNATDFSTRTFSMFGGETTPVTLIAEDSVMSAIIDRFGKDVEVTPIDDTRARIWTTVTASPTFFGWLAQFGRSVRIEKPAGLAQAYTEFLQDIVEGYAS